MMLKQDEEEINREIERRQYKKSSFRRSLLKANTEADLVNLDEEDDDIDDEMSESSDD